MMNWEKMQKRLKLRIINLENFSNSIKTSIKDSSQKNTLMKKAQLAEKTHNKCWAKDTFLIKTSQTVFLNSTVIMILTNIFLVTIIMIMMNQWTVWNMLEQTPDRVIT